MRDHPGRTIAVGILCSVAATIGLWSGALASASGALHSGTQPQVQTQTQTTPSHP
jgi:hypothetical protein